MYDQNIRDEWLTEMWNDILSSVEPAPAPFDMEQMERESFPHVDDTDTDEPRGYDPDTDECECVLCGEWFIADDVDDLMDAVCYDCR